MIVTSKTNNIIKYIFSLKNKKYRNKYNKYVIEGIKMVEEIINSEGIAPEFIIYSEDILKSTTIGNRFIDIIKKLNVKYNIVEVTKEIFEYISDLETPQGVLAVINKNEYKVDDLKNRLDLNRDEKYIILDKVQDPGNLGTIIRSAISFGIKNLICIEGTVDSFSPKVVRSTMGGITKVNIFNINEFEIDSMINLLKQNGYKLVGTALDSKNYIKDEKIDNKTIFVMGNEANGVTDKILNKCDKFIKIPMENIMESLNVATATSIVMYEQYVRGVNDAS